MSDDNAELEAMLIRHEGMKLHAYLCPAGKITIGVGRNLEDLGITKAEGVFLMRNDILRFRKEAIRAFDWFSYLDCVRQDVVVNMLINLGLSRFLGFRSMIAAIQRRDWDRAASEMLASKWASQVGKRAVELADMMRSGEYWE